jgi:hypothetical protein
MPTNFPTSVDNFTNPTANDSLNIPSHSLQHANANDAIEAVEDYLLTNPFGLRLVKKQTIGSAVSSVTVTGAFSASYENYKIIISGGVGSTANNILFTLGATSTGYYEARINCNYAGTISANATNNGSSGTIGQQTTRGLFANLDILTPFLAAQTNWGSTQLAATTSRVDQVQGMVDNSTSYTAFTITAGSGTLTGGTIYVYGYTI